MKEAETRGVGISSLLRVSSKVPTQRPLESKMRERASREGLASTCKLVFFFSAQSVLRQLSLTRRAGSEHHAVQQQHIVEYGEALLFDDDPREVCQVFLDSIFGAVSQSN